MTGALSPPQTSSNQRRDLKAAVWSKGHWSQRAKCKLSCLAVKIITFRIQNDANTQQEEDQSNKDNYQEKWKAAIKTTFAPRRLVGDDLHTGGLSAEIKW